MKTFSINPTNEIAAFARTAEAKQKASEGTAFFDSEEAFIVVAAAWPSARLVAVWNSLPGVNPVKKFTSRLVAAQRIWRQLQCLDPVVASVHELSEHRMANSHRQGTKRATVLALLSRPEGATIRQIRAGTGWLPHSVRGFLSNLNKAGTQVESFKAEGGDRAYRVSRQQSEPAMQSAANHNCSPEDSPESPAK